MSSSVDNICNIESDVTNVFFIQFLKYAATNNLSYDEIDKVIDVIENYLARRIICNMPGNALTQVFFALHKDVLKSIAEYQSAGVPLTCSYSDILAYHIMRRDGNYQLPRDVQFVTAIQTRDVYHMLKPYQIFLFERLENSVSGEYNDVAADMKKKDATIEHIMPQTLNGEWKNMLLTVVKVVMEQHADVIDSLYDKEGFFWSEKNADDRYCTKIAPHKYLWTSMDNRSKLRCLRYESVN